MPRRKLRRNKASGTETFLNQDIVHHLCKYLDIKDIKTCRLVSSCWNYGATPVLKERTGIVLHLSSGRYVSDVSLAEIIEKLKFSPSRVILSIPSYPGKTLKFPDFSIYPPILNLKSIWLNFPDLDRFRKENEICRKFILSSSTSLKELEFSPFVLGDCDSVSDFPSFGGTVFPKLTKLLVDSDRLEDDVEEHPPQIRETAAVSRILHAVTTSFPNLESLVIRCEHFVAILEQGLLQNWPGSLKCLQLHGHLNPGGMESLLKIPPGLKKLHLGADINTVDFTFGDRIDELGPLFYKLLRKQAPTLEVLGIATFWGGTKVLKFPVFPALKKLDLSFQSVETSVGFETGLGSGTFGEIKYAVGFPILEILNISIYWEEANGLPSWIAVFLPGKKSNRQVVQSVRKVDVYRNSHGVLPAKLRALLVDMFPNARDDKWG